MSRDRAGAEVLDRLRSRRWAIFAVWLAVLVVSFAAGGATLGLLVDYESVGTDDDPNTIQVVGNWAGFAPANDAAVANTDATNDAAVANTDTTNDAANETNSAGSQSDQGQGQSQGQGQGMSDSNGQGASAASVVAPATDGS